MPPLERNRNSAKCTDLQYPSFKQAVLFWLKLGFISFGGPAGQISIMHEFLVTNKKWISESRFMHALNYCMLLPGPEAQQLATYTGWLLHGVRGGLVAGLLFVLPGLIILLALSVLYVEFGQLPLVSAFFTGLKPAVVAIVLIAMLRIAKKSLIGYIHIGVAIASFVLIFFFHVSFPIVLALAFIVALIAVKFSFDSSNPLVNNEQLLKDEGGYIISQHTEQQKVRPTWRQSVATFLVALVLWLMPVLLLSIFSKERFWQELTLFFTKAAFVTFGGAYAVLPFVAEQSVQKYNWLSELQMIDGLALGESTPGPLILILVFVGFMAGFNTFGESLLMGIVGLFVTAYYTFLPSFLFVLVGAPYVERTRQNSKLKGILSVISASIVGVMLNLVVYFGKAVLIAPAPVRVDVFAVSILLLNLIALQQKASIVLCILVSGFLGVGYTILFL